MAITNQDRVGKGMELRSEKRKASGSLIEASATGAHKAWRETATPHADLARGRHRRCDLKDCAMQESAAQSDVAFAPDAKVVDFQAPQFLLQVLPSQAAVVVREFMETFLGSNHRFEGTARSCAW
jgi:hypothetical protein